MSCGVGRRCGLDLALPWLWCRPAAAALIRLLAWEPPHASGSALKRQTKQNKNKNKKTVSGIETVTSKPSLTKSMNKMIQTGTNLHYKSHHFAAGPWVYHDQLGGSCLRRASVLAEGMTAKAFSKLKKGCP